MRILVYFPMLKMYWTLQFPLIAHGGEEVILLTMALAWHLTDLSVDFEVLSNFRRKCLDAPEKDDPMYDKWYNNHKNKCYKNYAGSCNSMEQRFARATWERSIEKYGLRYTTMLSDGDSMSYNH